MTDRSIHSELQLLRDAIRCGRHVRPDVSQQSVDLGGNVLRHSMQPRGRLDTPQSCFQKLHMLLGISFQFGELSFRVGIFRDLPRRHSGNKPFERQKLSAWHRLISIHSNLHRRSATRDGDQSDGRSPEGSALSREAGR